MYTKTRWNLKTQCCLKKGRNRVKSAARYHFHKFKVHVHRKAMYISYIYKYEMSLTLMCLFLWVGVLGEWMRIKGIKKWNKTGPLCRKKRWWECAIENDWLDSAPEVQTKRKAKTQITLGNDTANFRMALVSVWAVGKRDIGQGLTCSCNVLSLKKIRNLKQNGKLLTSVEYGGWLYGFLLDYF